MMAVGAWFTDRIGLHAVFGAFIIGAGHAAQALHAGHNLPRFNRSLYALLLPLFFHFFRVKTQRSELLNSAFLWAVCGAILLAAVMGKGVACWLAARVTGLTNREAIGIGALMNARGLMELIIINIGLAQA